MKKTVLISVVLVLCFPAIAFSQAGKPFETLQQEINTLQAQVRNLQTQINNIGMTRAVYGLVFLDGRQSGTGFTTTYDNTSNVRTIHFDIPFLGTPHCIATADTQDPTTSCLAVATGPSTVDVTCASEIFMLGPAPGEYFATMTYGLIPQSFAFICVF